MVPLNVKISPHLVLGVGPDATPQEVRDAYHLKAKKYHPDAGGEEWEFRVLVQAYEMLSDPRRYRLHPPENATRPAPHRPEAPAAPAASPAGASGTTYDRGRLVKVEKLWIRYEVEHQSLWQGGPHDNRFLSCCLSVSWPDLPAASAANELPRAEQTLSELAEVFDTTVTRSRVVKANRTVEAQRFRGLTSYANLDRACSALKLLRDALERRGFGIRETTRDLLIPRDWR